MTHLELREKFKEFFKSKKHAIEKSSSLIPIDDPSLLFTTAGMLQFKPYYAGIKKAPYSRVATIQKCFRLSDLENIGKTARHHTFFEMFGNFCFMGDYFKKEAIEFAWEFSTQVIKLPIERIYVSIYEKDDDAFKIWNEHIGVPKEKIVRLGKKDNFWGPAGDSGACGPCSELYIDMGEEKGCGKPDCFVGCDCERYLEFWNLVFNEFFQDTDGNLSPLPNVGIDTGMGLERLCYITQGVESNYQTDVMKPIVDAIVKKLNVKYDDKNKTKINLIADHLRALVFVISEGCTPSNEGRGYVLRRLLRRALKTASDLGHKGAFLNEITSSVVNVYKEIYDYLPKEEENVKRILKEEENKFINTISAGMNKLYAVMEENKDSKIISGKDAFMLFDTYGLPIDITEEEASDHGFTVDKAGFEEAMEEQKKRSRGAGEDKRSKFGYVENYETKYVGEETDNLINGVNAKIVAVYEDNTKKDKTSSSNAVIITDVSPFYGEMGGQIGDNGYIENGKKEIIKIIDTQKKENTIIHIADCSGNSLSVGEEIKLFVNFDRRSAIRKNHTATHILQKVLELTLGNHVNQAGSFVSDEYLRFDFTHPDSISEDTLISIENQVNEVVFKSMPAVIKYMPKEEAISCGAKALFGEKYPDTVRILDIGNGFSVELCGGSHLTNTSEVGYFHIVSEGSVASGVRRIEAITGLKAANEASKLFSKVKNLAHILNASKTDELTVRAESLQNEVKKLQKEIKQLKTSGASAVSFMDNFEDLKGIRFYNLEFNEDIKEVRLYADTIKERVKDSISVMISKTDSSNSILVQITGNALKDKKLSANNIIKDIIAAAGGRGGGKDTFAQGSIENIEKAKEEINKLKSKWL
ncbi:alanine--tRNA ligase [Brachyspira hampsonii]|uniref:alanine--tRNA ligase n=1 Tax=Brachyspira hampsonii TaxID=1287055 RepID=UPI000D368B80|nr:alanine--tRNA ligase [Brachyspira hampsonii]PTY41329.1 alanyl-tRNA synthetase [Brachyspira hampsonii bv. II]